MKLDAGVLRYLTRDDFRVLTALELGMKNHDLVPTELIASIASLKHGGVHKVLGNLLRLKLIAHERSLYDGYRLVYQGYDFLALHWLLLHEIVVSFGRQIGVGKESDIYLIKNGSNKQFVLKLHRLGRTSFRKVKEKRDYIHERTSINWLYMSKLAALKEFSFMHALYDAKFPTPTPIAINRHAIVMSYVPGTLLANCRSLINIADTFHECMDLMTRLAACGLVHCDFNQFNLIVAPCDESGNVVQQVVDSDGEEEEDDEDDDDGSDGVMDDTSDAVQQKTAVRSGKHGEKSGNIPGGFEQNNSNQGKLSTSNFERIVMIDFPQMVSIDHVNAQEFFDRDVKALRVFFERRFGYTAGSYPTFESVVVDSRISRLDVAIHASGFSKEQAAELDKAMGSIAAEIQQARVVSMAKGDDEEEEEKVEEEEVSSDQDPASTFVKVELAEGEEKASMGLEFVQELSEMEVNLKVGDERNDAPDEDGDEDDGDEDEDDVEGQSDPVVPDDAEAAALARKYGGSLPDGIRNKPGGRRTQHHRSGEAYLQRIDEVQHIEEGGELDGLGGARNQRSVGYNLSKTEIKQRVKHDLKRTVRKTEAAAVSRATHGKANTEKDRIKANARRIASDPSGGW
jgi:RIO kinase 2